MTYMCGIIVMNAGRADCHADAWEMQVKKHSANEGMEPWEKMGMFFQDSRGSIRVKV